MTRLIIPQSIEADRARLRLKKQHSFWFTGYTALSAFCLYTCVYAFRKAFPAATFEGIMLAGISYKVWLIIFQATGYALSKFIGIKFISELTRSKRKQAILLLTGIAGLSWLFFALVPTPYNMIFLFTNGLPLGMVWGIIFSYLEGRKVTEVLGAALCVSFIFSAGLCRSVGAYLIVHWGISEFWMPFVTGCIFTPPLLFFLHLLDRVPAQSEEDIQLRSARQPMNRAERMTFIKTFLPGIVLIVLGYVLLTTFRDFRDNFSAEVWRSLGYGNSPALFTATEIPVSIIVLIIMSMVMFIRNNAVALLVNHVIVISGMACIGIATLLFEGNLIGAEMWMILIGLGLYMGYVPFNSIFFERLLATFQYSGTVGFIMYVTDSFGYVGSLAVLFVKEFSFSELSWLDVYITSGYIISVSGTILITLSMLYFQWKRKNYRGQHATPGGYQRG